MTQVPMVNSWWDASQQAAGRDGMKDVKSMTSELKEWMLLTFTCLKVLSDQISTVTIKYWMTFNDTRRT